MDFSCWPRHQLRAQGRLRERPDAGVRNKGKSGAQLAQSTGGKLPERISRRDSITKSSQLLNFLARTASQSQNSILKPSSLPDFAMVKLRDTAALISDLSEVMAAKSKTMQPEIVTAEVVQAEIPQLPERSADEVLGSLADSLAALAGVTVFESELQVGTFALSQLDEQLVSLAAENITNSALAMDIHGESASSVALIPNQPNSGTNDLEQSEGVTNISLFSDCAIALETWFNSAVEPFEQDESFEISFQPHVGTSKQNFYLPAALPAVLNVNYDANEIADSDVAKTPAAATFGKSSHFQLSARKRPSGNLRSRRQLFKRLVVDAPEVTVSRSGGRLEAFENGAKLKKDPLGRVTSIRSRTGVNLVVSYDHEGYPVGFIRSDKRGQTHLVGQRDKHGVIVRDADGRVRAAGETMFIDPAGCLSVRRSDGQFWSLDLVKGILIERRSIVDSSGEWNFLTAVFAADGFRMMTRFQAIKHDSQVISDRLSWLAQDAAGTFRFYGRDGSVIQFEGEHELTELKPSRVWAPGSRQLEVNWRGNHQGGTAWDSVQEYVTSYLAV